MCVCVTRLSTVGLRLLYHRVSIRGPWSPGPPAETDIGSGTNRGSRCVGRCSPTPLPQNPFVRKMSHVHGEFMEYTWEGGIKAWTNSGREDAENV